MQVTPGPRPVALAGELAIVLANRVIQACAERGVLLMPLKGVLLLAQWPALRGRRHLVDVDFLVRQDDVRTTSMALRELGFEATVHSSAGSTYASDAWPLAVDLHEHLFPHGLFSMPTDEVFSRADLDASLFAAPVARMSDPDLLAHLLGHFVKGRGVFREDTSLDDLRWLLDEGVVRAENVEALGAHLHALGLHRAAGFVLGHDSFKADSTAAALVRTSSFSRADRAAIAFARWRTIRNQGEPRWWTPHLLNRSFDAGARSLVAHAAEATGRRASGLSVFRERASRASVTELTR